MNYDVDYFIAKFEAIPSKEIGNSQLTGCAYGQCQSRFGEQDGHHTKEGIALTKLMSSIKGMVDFLDLTDNNYPYEATPARINNGDVLQYQQSTPKKRILAALYDIKKLQQPAIETTQQFKEVTFEKIKETTQIKQSVN